MHVYAYTIKMKFYLSVLIRFHRNISMLIIKSELNDLNYQEIIKKVIIIYII
jgi:hypothetical protein